MNWVAQDNNSHTENWTIQTRVVNAAGLAGATSAQTVVLDTIAPNAPTEVSVVGKDVTIKLADTGLKIGDVLDIVSGGKHITHALTAADITAQNVALTLPSDMIGDVQGKLYVGVIDKAGNTSDYRSAAWYGSETFDFNNLTNNQILGKSYSVGTMTVECEQGIRGYYNPGGYTGTPMLVVGNYDVHYLTKFTLKAPASRIQFEWDADNSHAETYVAFFDESGVEIGRQSYAASSALARGGKVDFTAPAGKEIASFHYATPGGDAEGTVIDNVIITRATESMSVVVPPELVQTVSGAAQTYHGGAGDNVFLVADAGDLTTNGASVHGGLGVDTLKLTGVDEVLDLTLIPGKIDSVEVFDITGVGNSTLILGLSDVLNNGSVNQFYEGDKSRVQVLVKGDTGDTVKLSDLLANGSDVGDWSRKSSVSIDGVAYDSYQHSTLGAELLVQQGVTVEVQNHGASVAAFTAAANELGADVLTGSTDGENSVNDQLAAMFDAGDDAASVAHAGVPAAAQDTTATYGEVSGLYSNIVSSNPLLIDDRAHWSAF